MLRKNRPWRRTNLMIGMKFQLYIIILAVCLTNSSFSLENTRTVDNTLPASELSPYGRFLFTDQKHVELISSAVHFGFRFRGKECQVFAYLNDNNGHNYLQYELDGVYQKRVKIEGNNKNPFVISASADGEHTVWIYKATEAHTGPIFIEKITGESLQPIGRPRAPLIEFIGNSITCGAAADPSEVPCGAGAYHDQHNAYYAYGPRVARALSTNFIVSGVSGIGIYRTWNMDGPSMPQVYEKSDFQLESQGMWKFENYKPDVVSIALGTNDLSRGDGKHARPPFDSAVFVSGYIKFVQQVKSKYVTAQIALLSSGMVHGKDREKFQNCLSAVKENIDALYPNDKPVALYFFKPMQARGCTGHPNVEDHAILAEELIPFFKKLI
jgi:hypothetical protein